MTILRRLLATCALACPLAVATLMGVVPAAADKRVALVIGNSTYRNVPSLANPRNDARLMADTLRDLGFTLVGGGAQLDLDKAGLDTAVRSFGSQLQGADVGLFYYAGHGVQVRGANYLVPVNANPTREADVDFELGDLALVLRQMEASGTKLNLVILDACRNNPFGGRGLRATDPGLAQMRAPEGTLISFATQPGNVAKDGADGNSPFTKALAQTIRQPGLGIFDAINEVGLQVKRATGGEQQPWFSTSPIDGRFFFAAPQPVTAPAPIAAPIDPCGAAEAHWRSAEAIGTQSAFDDHLARFANCAFAGLAKARIAALRNADADAKRKADEDRQKLAVVAPPVALPALVETAPKPAVVAPPALPAVPCGSGTVGVALSSRPACPLSAAEERALKPKDSFKECDTCPEMVVVQGGSFAMGSPAREANRVSDEGPQHTVTFARPFAVGRFAVTFDEWDACAADGGCNGYKPDDDGWGRGRRPVIHVSWDEANSYAAWLSRRTGGTYRLLSEAEREYVTRAGTTTAFWWGSSISTSQANYHGLLTYGGGPKGEARQMTLPVDSFQANPWGLYQVHGNVMEWIEDWYHDSYKGAPADGSAWTTKGSFNVRMARGGSWGSDPRDLRAARRTWPIEEGRYNTVGFRVARTLPDPRGGLY